MRKVLFGKGGIKWVVGLIIGMIVVFAPAMFFYFRVPLHEKDIAWVKLVGGLPRESKVLYPKDAAEEIRSLIGQVNKAEDLGPTDQVAIDRISSRARPLGVQFRLVDGTDVVVWMMLEIGKDGHGVQSSAEKVILERKTGENESYRTLRSKEIVPAFFKTQKFPDVEMLKVEISKMGEGKGYRISASGESWIASEVRIRIRPAESMERGYLIGKIKTTDGKWTWELTGEGTIKTLDGKTIELTSGEYEITAETDELTMGKFQSIQF